MIDVALFPIPQSVCFPGVPCPLHVFEPRYRQMVRHCIDEGMPMGICHTEKVVHANTRQQTVEEALSSNQSTYKPCQVFSAGPVELTQELEDGRMLITVQTQMRLSLGHEKQTLPFGIWACEELPDESPGDAAEADMSQYKEKILQRLITLTDKQPALQQQLQSDYWQAMPAQDFSFAMAGRIQMDPDLAQHLLESTDPVYRLDLLLKLINGE